MTITYSAAAAAQLADVTLSTVYTWARMGAVAAHKAGRRWVINAASLAHRISLGIRRTRKATTMDLDTTYTTTLAGYGELTITPKVKRRADRTVVRGIMPLLADKLAEIPAADRPHVELLLHGAMIAILDNEDTAPDNGLTTSRDNGRLLTTYQGHPALTTDEVLDLAAQIRTHLNG
ncbi:helix-turn-helix domain-containing protein [Nocardiopsis tropica]|uniref:Helix-turn-helix domain-containing protein n=1 Tax=Nocardiopsis tropica TaxID=109330 RepID=A0ABU7KZD5_9ACTN|nr:helix-turn-helix domain-containing protein [Nocardiopsis umidischolae]MEE2054668.1 helix-turn-helix domain-containing protein [Nocardiopsis umidischolae]